MSLFLEVNTKNSWFLLMKTNCIPYFSYTEVVVRFDISYKEGLCQIQVIFLIIIGNANFGKEYFLCSCVLVDIQVHSDYNS